MHFHCFFAIWVCNLFGWAVNFRGRPSPMQLHHDSQAAFKSHNTPPPRHTHLLYHVLSLIMRCVVFAPRSHTHSHTSIADCWIDYIPIFPHTSEPLCLLALPDPNYLLTSVNPCIPNTPDPQPPTSHLLLPCPLLYYPAGIALGTLQSSDSTPVTPSDRRGEQRTMTCCEGRSLVLRVYVALLLKVSHILPKFELKRKIKSNFLFLFTARDELMRGLVSYTQHQEEILIFYDS